MEQRSEFVLIDKGEFEMLVEIEFGRSDLDDDQVVISPWLRKKNYGFMLGMRGSYKPISNMQKYLVEAEDTFEFEFDDESALLMKVISKFPPERFKIRRMVESRSEFVLLDKGEYEVLVEIEHGDSNVGADEVLLSMWLRMKSYGTMTHVASHAAPVSNMENYLALANRYIDSNLEEAANFYNEYFLDFSWLVALDNDDDNEGIAVEQRSEFVLIDKCEFEVLVEIEFGRSDLDDDQVMISPWLRKKNYGIMVSMTSLHKPISNIENYIKTAEEIIDFDFSHMVERYIEDYE